MDWEPPGLTSAPLSSHVRFCLVNLGNFPGFIIGSMGPLLIFAAINSGECPRIRPGCACGHRLNSNFGALPAIIQACPPEMSGVAGAAMNSMFQIGAITALSVQTGLTSTSSLQIFDWRASQVGFWWVPFITTTVLAFLSNLQ